MINSFNSEPIPIDTTGLTTAEVSHVVALHSGDTCRPRKGECGLCVRPDSSGELVVKCAGYQPPDKIVPYTLDDYDEVRLEHQPQPLEACRHPDRLRQIAESIEASIRAEVERT